MYHYNVCETCRMITSIYDNDDEWFVRYRAKKLDHARKHTRTDGETKYTMPSAANHRRSHNKRVSQLTILVLQVSRVIRVFIVDEYSVFLLQMIERKIVRRWPHRSAEKQRQIILLFCTFCINFLQFCSIQQLSVYFIKFKHALKLKNQTATCKYVH